MSVGRDLIELSKLRLIHLAALTASIVGIGTACFIRKITARDPDMWWHLCVGNWIVQNRAFPHTGIFSGTAANRPWRAYSWGYELLLSRAYDWFSFVGMGVFGTALTIAVAVVVFVMLLRVSGRFWVAWSLSGIVCISFLFNVAPRPLFFSVILFTITVGILFEARRSGQIRLLYWLPLVMWCWANLHIQFIYGIGVVGLYAGINLLQRIAVSRRIYPEFLTAPAFSAKQPFVVLACCIAATCGGPYSFQLYRVVFEYSTSAIIYRTLIEFQALSFNTWNQYLELLLGIGAFFALGWQKKLDPFKLALLIFAAVFAFRTWRDAWFLCVAGAMVIGDFPVPEPDRDRPLPWSNWAAVSAISVLLLALVMQNTDFTTRGLDRVISSQYPVDAVNFLRRNPVPGPLYNTFDWGGFLIFYMPQLPVSIDGRTDLYGDVVNEQYNATQEAEPSYVNDPILNQAGVVILQNKFPIANMLSVDRRFRVIYRDDLATVLVHNP